MSFFIRLPAEFRFKASDHSESGGDLICRDRSRLANCQTSFRPMHRLQFAKNHTDSATSPVFSFLAPQLASIAGQSGGFSPRVSVVFFVFHVGRKIATYSHNIKWMMRIPFKQFFLDLCRLQTRATPCCPVNNHGLLLGRQTALQRLTFD